MGSRTSAAVGPLSMVERFQMKHPNLHTAHTGFALVSGSVGCTSEPEETLPLGFQLSSVCASPQQVTESKVKIQCNVN